MHTSALFLLFSYSKFLVGAWRGSSDGNREWASQRYKTSLQHVGPSYNKEYPAKMPIVLQLRNTELNEYKNF